MLRFDSTNKQPPRNYLARREQLRLLIMITALAVVGLMAWQVRSERSRAVLAQMFGGGPAAAKQGSAPPDAARPGGSTPLDDTRQWLNPVQLDSIRDNAVFRSAETDAWFAVLGQLKSLDEPLAPPAATPVGYAQLSEQPQAYRGRTVLVQGAIKRVEPQTPAENELGIERLYRVVFQPQGDEVWPIAVYTLEPPAGVALSQPVSRPASAVGVFFKNQSYQSRAGAGTMPVVLARSVTAAPAAEAAKSAPSEPVEGTDLLIMAAIAAAVAVVVVLIVVRQSGKQGRQRRSPL